MNHCRVYVAALTVIVAFLIRLPHSALAFTTLDFPNPKLRDNMSQRHQATSSDENVAELSSIHNIQYHYSNLQSPNNPAVLFCNGFRSSMNGNKALFLEEHCQQRGVSSCRFDYRGHGISCPDTFLDHILSDWIQDTEHILLNVLESHEKVVLVGSSMGAWIAFHVALRHPDRIAGIVGVASGIDFTENIYRSATEQQRNDWNSKGVAYFPSQYEDEPYPISRNLIQDAQEKWLLLHQPSIPITCPVRLLHGQNDEDVPWQVSMQLNDRLDGNDTVLTLIKDGDHRLSRQQDLQRMVGYLDELLDQ